MKYFQKIEKKFVELEADLKLIPKNTEVDVNIERSVPNDR